MQLLFWTISIWIDLPSITQKKNVLILKDNVQSLMIMQCIAVMKINNIPVFKSSKGFFCYEELTVVNHSLKILYPICLAKVHGVLIGPIKIVIPFLCPFANNFCRNTTDNCIRLNIVCDNSTRCNDSTLSYGDAWHND